MLRFNRFRVLFLSAALALGLTLLLARGPSRRAAPPALASPGVPEVEPLPIWIGATASVLLATLVGGMALVLSPRARSTGA